jgi:aromatic ring-opening dioxygenase LigB subunit
MADAMQVEILADGTMKVTTSKVSMANHLNAEKFLAFASELMGGVTKRVRRAGMLHSHDHDHGHDHSHSHA